MNRNLAIAVFATLSTLESQSIATPRQIVAHLSDPPSFERIFGQRVAYHEFGVRHRGRTTLILIPHLQWDANAWTANAAVIASKYHVIAIDPLGQGKSDKPMINYKMGTWTDVLREFLRKKRIQKAVFAGAGMGGALSVQMALDYPEVVEGIIVAGSSSGPGEHKGSIYRAPSYTPTLAGTRNYLLDHFYDKTLVTDKAVRTRFEQLLEADDGYTVEHHLADHRPPYSATELSKIRVPAKFIWCREDAITPLKWGEQFANATPRGELAVMERCGHFPNIEQPEKFNAAVIRFLDRMSEPRMSEPRSLGTARHHRRLASAHIKASITTTHG